MTHRPMTSPHAHRSLQDLSEKVFIERKPLRFCKERLGSLMQTLELANLDKFQPINMVATFATLVGTYQQGFSLIIEPYDDRVNDTRPSFLFFSFLSFFLSRLSFWVNPDSFVSSRARARSLSLCGGIRALLPPISRTNG